MAAGAGPSRCRADAPVGGRPASPPAAGQVGGPESSGLTLTQVVRLALERNERTKLADLSLIAADASVRRARSGFLPTLSLGGTETLRPYTVEQNGRTVVRDNAASGAVTLSQPLLSVTTFPLYAGANHNA